MKQARVTGLLVVLALASCTAHPEAARGTASAGTQTSAALDSIAASTLSALSTQTARAPLTATRSAASTHAVPSPTSGTPAPTPTPAQVWIEVRIDTNCRLGPGPGHEMVGALFVGERTIVLQRSAVPDYWVVDNPDRPGYTCYLWGKYATLEGDIGALPLDIPPTATALPASINGWVFADQNGNGVRDPAESGLLPDGIQLLLKVGACPGSATLRVVEPNAYGRIMIQPLLAGTYCLAADPDSPPLDPARLEIQLNPNQQFDQANFRLLP